MARIESQRQAVSYPVPSSKRQQVQGLVDSTNPGAQVTIVLSRVVGETELDWRRATRVALIVDGGPDESERPRVLPRRAGELVACHIQPDHERAQERPVLQHSHQALRDLQGALAV